MKLSILCEEAKDGIEAVDKIEKLNDNFTCCKTYKIILMDWD